MKVVATDAPTESTSTPRGLNPSEGRAGVASWTADRARDCDCASTWLGRPGLETDPPRATLSQRWVPFHPALSGGLWQNLIVNRLSSFWSAKLWGVVAIVLIALALRIAASIWGISPNIITADGNGYFAWARNIALEQTFDFSNDVRALYPPDPIPTYPKSPINGKTINEYPPGLGLIELPAFFLAHGMAKVLGVDTSGVHGLYDRVVVAWLVLISIAGYLAFWGCTERLGARSRISAWVVLATYLASNLAHYVTKEPFMAHATGFALAAIGSYLLLSSSFADSWRRPTLAGLVLGFLLITRNSNLALAPWFVALALFRRVPLHRLFQMGFLMLLPIAAQGFLFWLMKGQLGFEGYSDEQTFSAGIAGLGNVLFSAWRGLFVFHPIFLFLVMVSVLGALRQSPVRVLFIGALTCFIGAWIINGTWWCWWFGASFGNRAFIEFLPPLSLAWCAGWCCGVFKSRFVRLFPATISCCLALNAVAWSGYLLKRYSHVDPLTLSDTYLWWTPKGHSTSDP